MKRALILFLIVTLFASFSLVLAEDSKIYVKVDMGYKALIKFADVDSEEVYEQVPTSYDYPGYSMIGFLPLAEKVKVIVYLKNKETGNFVRDEGEMFKDEVSTNEDLYLDYTDQILKRAENPDKSGEQVATISEEVTESAPPIVSQPEIPVSNSQSITGNAVASPNDNNTKKYWVLGGVLVVLFSIILFMIIQHNRQKLLDEIPEEKELLQLKKREEVERKAVVKVKTEQKLKESIEKEKKRIAMKLAVEEAELSELGKEGLEARRREAERFDRKNVGDKKSFY
jgi:hypothetical protein